jgi:hypothetical protein
MADSIVHAIGVEVPVLGGAHKVRVRPWRMAQRAELRPKVAALLDRIETERLTQGTATFAKLLTVAEAEIAEVVRASVELPPGVAWDDLLWPEDLITLGQAVWETSVVRKDGTGAAGKVIGVLRGIAGASGAPKQAPKTPTEPS